MIVADFVITCGGQNQAQNPAYELPAYTNGEPAKILRKQNLGGFFLLERITRYIIKLCFRL